MATVRIPLSSRKYPGLFALIDEEDVPLVAPYRWHIHPNGTGLYARTATRIDGKRTLLQMHRVILSVAAGVLVDHRDMDGLNNTRANLRPATHPQNHANHRRQTNNTSGYTGVSLHTDGKWMAYIKHERKRHYLGLYATPGDAARAYDAAARQFFGAFARLNFPG